MYYFLLSLHHKKQIENYDNFKKRNFKVKKIS